MYTKTRYGIISMNRGDTFSFVLDVNVGSGVCPKWYTLQTTINPQTGEEEKDYLYFALLEPNQRWEDAILKKTYDSTDILAGYSNPILRIDTEDTEYLRPGTYYYQVKLFRAGPHCEDGLDHVDTVIPRTKFIILE